MSQHPRSKTFPGQEGPSREVKVWAPMLTAPDYAEGLRAPLHATHPHSSLLTPENARAWAQNPARHLWQSLRPLRKASWQSASSPHPTKGTLRCCHRVSALHLRCVPFPSCLLMPKQVAGEDILHGGPGERLDGSPASHELYDVPTLLTP